MDKPLRIVKLLEPHICQSCRFYAVATVVMSDGSQKRMMHCKRLDCDNFDISHQDNDKPERLEDV